MSNGSSKLFMISAMYENGGNTTHRMLDGHPELYVYPYESQLGTSLVSDFLVSFVPFKYRWPEFPLTGNPGDDYELFFDEEMKTRLRVPDRSKFRHADMQLTEADRKASFIKHAEAKPRSRGNLVMSFFESTFDAWKNYARTGNERHYLGYSPVIGIDGDKMIADLPDMHVIHVIRNPYSGYADTKKRPFPLSLARYAWTWNFMQHMAMVYAEKHGKNFHIVRFEDLVADPEKTMKKLAGELGIDFSPTMLYPSWNGKKLEEVYPWGTVRTPTTEANIATMNELSSAEKDQIKQLSGFMLRQLGYDRL